MVPLSSISLQVKLTNHHAYFQWILLFRCMECLQQVARQEGQDGNGALPTDSAFATVSLLLFLMLIILRLPYQFHFPMNRFLEDDERLSVNNHQIKLSTGKCLHLRALPI